MATLKALLADFKHDGKLGFFKGDKPGEDGTIWYNMFVKHVDGKPVKVNITEATLNELVKNKDMDTLYLKDTELKTGKSSGREYYNTFILVKKQADISIDL